MKLSKWGNSFAVRIPVAMVQEANLKEGDTVTLRLVGNRELEISRDLAKLQALEAIRKLRRPLPPGYKFDREEANERGSYEGMHRAKS